MKKLFVLVAMVGALVLLPRPSWADPRKELDDAILRMEQGVPIIMKTLKILQRDGGQLMQVMERANAEAVKQGGGLTTPPANGEMPSAETLAQKIRGLQAIADVMRQAIPILQRTQRDLEPHGMHPGYDAPVVTPGKTTAPAAPTRVDPELQN